MFTKFLIIGILLVIVAIYFDPTYLLSIVLPSDFSDKTHPPKKLFTSEELKLYNGVDEPELYLAILGKVFDVSKGIKHYGPGETYNFFIGRDTSRSFITGKFEENEASDLVADLTSEELRSLNHWIQFYGKQYMRIGKLIGRYYRKDGKLTHYGKEVKKLIKAAEQQQENEESNKNQFPPCNVEWDAVKGSRVWCTDRSGGIKRDWVGVPRQLYQPGSEQFRCACVKPDFNAKNLKQYPGCDSESNSCYVKE